MSVGGEHDRRYYGEALRIDLPFIALRVARAIAFRSPLISLLFDGFVFGIAMNEDDAYERIRQRVRARLTLYRHVVTYAAVVAALVFIDLVTGGGLSGWVLWPAAIFGALLILEAFNVFVVPSVWSPEAEERMIEEELRKEQNNH